MNRSDLDVIAGSAVQKADLLEHKPFTYFMRALMAGFYLVVAIILSNICAAVLLKNYPEFSKLTGSFLFPIAIVLIVFLGAELFTGNNMTMAVGCYQRKVTVKQLALVWIVSYIGNFIGSFLLSYLFVKSGSSSAILIDYYNQIIEPKLALTPLQMVLRGVLCNFLVCIAVLVGSKMKTESGKLIVMFPVIMAFVVAGFEHSIANMGTYSIAYLLLGKLPMALVFKSMFFVTIGNMIGGAVLLALPLKLMSIDDK
ncbi:formate efflux transporter [Lachnospiraceae bacterium KM106-2]|nr:formate efflux transporter [Lachnospiraceae bacterium KM106-2]